MDTAKVCKYCGKVIPKEKRYNVFCNLSCSSSYNNTLNKNCHPVKKHKRALEKYNESPRLCKYCGEVIPYEKRFNLFCGHSCSATFNNKKRERVHIKHCLACSKELENSQRKYCSLSCMMSYKRYAYIKKWLNGDTNGTIAHGKPSSHIRNWMIETIGKCEICGWDKVNTTTGNKPLEIHHKDGNHKNNTRDNLQLICPNCHSLTSTFRALNKGNGRESRR